MYCSVKQRTHLITLPPGRSDAVAAGENTDVLPSDTLRPASSQNVRRPMISFSMTPNPTPRFTGMLLAILGLLLAAPTTARADGVPADASPEPAATVERPWDYDPYRVMIWIVPTANRRPEVQWLRPPLEDFLDRDFAAVWNTTIAEAPQEVQIAARRGMDQLSYDLLTASDPVIALKRNHLQASRIRTTYDVTQRVKQVLAPASYVETALQQAGEPSEGTDLSGIRKLIQTTPASLSATAAAWADPATEAVLLPRAMAAQLSDPDPKLITLKVDGLIADVFRKFDKLFIVRLDDDAAGMTVQAIEFDCLMRSAGPVVESQAMSVARLPAQIGRAITQAFAPVVRIDQAGVRSASGLLRAGGLILDPDSPAAVGTGDLLQPMMRRDDRSGDPLILQTIDWAYLLVTEVEAAKLQMQLYAGRTGGLQGRRNQRTHRVALKVRPQYPQTTIRLHAAGKPDQPLQGYEIHEKDLESGEWTLVGRTDWDGRLRLEKEDVSLRLLYVKNGEVVLARLPTVVGLTPLATADLTPDDIRLRGEAYIRGVQNAIIDLVALRQLLAARIRLRLEKGQLDEAQQLLDALREQPTYETIARDMSKKQSEIQSSNPYEQRKLDGMFATTRELLVKHIGSSLIRQLEAEVAAAKQTPAAAEGTAAAAEGTAAAAEGT